MINYTNDKNINNLSNTILNNRYLLNGELYQELFFRVSLKYSEDLRHCGRIYDYMNRLLFVPSTPILSNGGAKRGLPISCFINEVRDSLEGIVSIWNENIWLSSKGGGIGSCWDKVRSVGEKISNSGRSSGIIPFLAIQDRLTLAISQGSLRRGSSAIYISVSHPEIEEFIDIRRPTGGDLNRKMPNLHHGIIISDKFMLAIKKDLKWKLKSPKSGNTIYNLRAREIWRKILLSRMETGEPYILFIDTINRNRPKSYKKHNMVISSSNLCTEISLVTGLDYIKNHRTAVCCLSSLNICKYNVWNRHPTLILDIMIFLDNVLQDFIDSSPRIMFRAKYSSYRERSVGLGIVGLHSFFQSKLLEFGEILSRIWNLKIFRIIHFNTQMASKIIGRIKGSSPDLIKSCDRFMNKTAVAPTASISIISGGLSPGIEPHNSNFYLQKTIIGSLNIKNFYLEKLLMQIGKNKDNIWSVILENEGSIKKVYFLDSRLRMFNTAFEINQKSVIDLASDRSIYICQMQSINIFISSRVNKRDLNDIYYYAWAMGIKSIYYNRSKSLQRANDNKKEII